MNREDQLRRYRHLRAIATAHHSAVLELVPTEIMLDFGRRLGLAKGRTFMLDSMDQYSMVADLAVYTSRDGRTRAIDRYARKTNFAPGSDEDIMLRSAQAAWFTAWHVVQRHDTAGLLIRDVLKDATFRLMDLGHEASAKPGDMFVGRVKAVDDCVMTCGVALPFGETMLEEFTVLAPHQSTRDMFAVFQNPRFATAIYRAAVRIGLFDRLAFIDADTDTGQLAAAD